MSHNSSHSSPVQLRNEQLSTAKRRLVRLLSHVYFGRIEYLHVRAGEPAFDPAPRVIRTLKVGGRNEHRPQAGAADFLLKDAVVELLAHIQRLHDGVVERIEVAHGLPLILEVQEPIAV